MTEKFIMFLIRKTERNGTETAFSIGQKLWDKVPTEIKNSKTLEEFKARIKVGFPKTVLARYVNCLLNM